MSVSRPLRCLFANSSKSFPRVHQSFHTCSPLYVRQPKYPSIKAEDLGLVTNEAPVKKSITPQSSLELKPYVEDDWKALAQIYTPEQLEAIKAGEAAVDREDLSHQGTFREDSFALPYFEDLSFVHPVVDKPVRAPESNSDPNFRFKDEDELLDDVTDWAMNLSENSEQPDWAKFRDNMRLTVGKEESERNPRSYLAPNLPRIDGLHRHKNSDDIPLAMRRLMKQTGYSRELIRSFRLKVLVSHRVVNQTRFGKIQSMYFLAVAGNLKGMLGIGEGKSVEPMDAHNQACMAAIRNMVPIPRYEGRTIYGDVKAKVGATVVEVMTRPPGTSILRMFQSRRHDSFRRRTILLKTIFLIIYIYRFWNPMSIIHLRTGPMCRHPRSGRASLPVPQPHEHSQGHYASTGQPAIARTRSKSIGKETGGFEESVL